MKKKLYQKPKISKGLNWYIEWYESSDGLNWSRKRVTYGINRVKKLKDREFLAQAVLEKVERMLESSSIVVDPSRNLFDSIRIAVKSKFRDGRMTSNKVYINAKNHFFGCGQPIGWGNLNLADFDTDKAGVFVDYLIDKGLSNRSINNVIRVTRGLFNVMVARDWIELNPFRKVKKMKEVEYDAYIMTKDEMSAIIAKADDVNPILSVCLKLQFYCLIRPVEITRLRLRDFDLAKGVVFVSANNSKNKKSGTPTLPTFLIEELADIELYTQDWFLAGAGLKVSPKRCGTNTMYNQHRKVLDELVLEGVLPSDHRIKLYSWKYAGMTYFSKMIDAADMQRQARHHSIDQSLRYVRKADNVAASIRDIDAAF